MKIIKIDEQFKIFRFKKFHALQVIIPFLILKHLVLIHIVIVEEKILLVVVHQNKIEKIIIIHNIVLHIIA